MISGFICAASRFAHCICARTASMGDGLPQLPPSRYGVVPAKERARRLVALRRSSTAHCRDDCAARYFSRWEFVIRVIDDVCVTVTNQRYLSLILTLILSPDYYIVVEVDSYGHYFRKAKSKLVCRSAHPRWNESFTIDLEGSQNLRLLLYEDAARPVLRGKCTLKVSFVPWG